MNGHIRLHHFKYQVVINMSLLFHAPATMLSVELLLGGQARLPFSPTPSLNSRAMAKADGTLTAFSFISFDAVTFPQVVGVAICIASVNVALSVTRVAGLVMSGYLLLMGCKLPPLPVRVLF